MSASRNLTLMSALIVQCSYIDYYDLRLNCLQHMTEKKLSIQEMLEKREEKWKKMIRSISPVLFFFSPT